MNKSNQKSFQVGIGSWGTAIPHYAVNSSTIASVQGKSDNPGKSLGVNQKTCPELDEDTATLATDACFEALSKLQRTEIKNWIGSLLIGSESHPYAVKPTGTIVAQALSLPNFLSMADLQFACKAGTQSMQLVFAQVQASQVQAGLAVGADTAQAKPGDILEYTAGAGAGAFLIANSSVLPLAATLEYTLSYTTDTPDFWRRTASPYPEHAGRFSGEPAYFTHVVTLATKIMENLQMTAADFDYCVFHTPNAKFPEKAAKILGFNGAQLQYSLPVKQIGNTYAGAVPIALANVLDQAGSNKTILVISYGSGAGADGFVFKTTNHIKYLQSHSLSEKVDKLKLLDGSTYLTFRNRLRH